MRIVRFDHVQLAIPPGGEALARSFYAGLLGIPEQPKPPELAARGGVWFEHGELRLHLGVEQEFRPAKRAHPALEVEGLAELIERLQHAGVRVLDDQQLPGYARVFVHDPFGNRIELLEPSPYREVAPAAGT